MSTKVLLAAFKHTIFLCFTRSRIVDELIPHTPITAYELLATFDF